MRKMKFIAEEFLRSFRKSLFKNILLMLMLSISLVMAVIMCSYYFDLGDRYSDMNVHIGDSSWQTMALGLDRDEFTNSFTTVAGCRNMMNYYETLSSSAEYPMFSANTQQGVYLREDEVQHLFGDRSYQSFLDKDQPESVSAVFGDETCSVLCFSSAQIDLKAYKLFGLRTDEGEGFTKENMTIEKASDPIPVLLGYDYKGILHIGDTMEINFWNYIYPCRVVGILEKGATFPEAGDTKGEMCQLDPILLFPYGIRLLENPTDVKDIARYAINDFTALEDGVVQIMDDKKLNEQVGAFRDIGQKFGLPPVRMNGTSMGVNLLRKESDTTVQILLMLTVVLLCFTFYGLFVTFYDKIQSNSRVYGIYLMNGCSLGMILLSCLLEIVVILLPSFLISRYIFTNQFLGYYHIDVIMKGVCGFVGMAFLTGAGFIVFLMRGVDTEHLIRQKE